MWNNRYALYLGVGCAVMLISGFGLAYQFTSVKEAREAPPAPQQSVQSSIAQSSVTQSSAPAEWPPANSAVAFHDEMLELLTPPKAQTAATPEPQQTTEPPQQAAPQREVVREAAPERRGSRASQRRQAPPDDAISPDGRSPSDDVGAGDGRDRGRYTRERNRDDVYVRGRDGRRYRIDPADRAEADREPPSDLRGYRTEREPPPERRGLMPDPFRLFGPRGGYYERW